MENIRNTCNISEVILLGKEIELLLLKKDVEEKLNMMNQVETKALPATIEKEVDFQSGQVDLGFLVHLTEGMSSYRKESVVVKARRMENGKATSRWLSAVVTEAKSDPSSDTNSGVAANKNTVNAVKEQAVLVVKQPLDCYELMETKEHSTQTDFFENSKSDADVEDENGVMRRRRRKPE